MRFTFDLPLNKYKAVVLVLAILICGCSRGKRDITGDVFGKVSLEGKPTTTGSISFVSKEGKVASGILDSNGAYAIKNVVVGKYRVLVLPPSLPHPGMPGSVKKKGMADFPDFPVKYRSDTTTDFEAEVVKGKHDHSFDMKPDPPPAGKRR